MSGLAARGRGQDAAMPEAAEPPREVKEKEPQPHLTGSALVRLCRARSNHCLIIVIAVCHNDIRGGQS